MNVRGDKHVAAILGLSPQDFSNRKKRGSLLPVVIEWAINENVNLDWLIRGENQTQETKQIDRETAIINKMLEAMTEEQKAEVRKYCEMSECYKEMKSKRKAG